MENIEYVRVRGGDPLVRFQAEYAERWEDRQTMELRNFSFEQMEDSGDTVNADGKAAFAIVQIGSGDISLKGGVRIRVESEDVTIRTSELEWKDKDKILSGAAGDEVDIQRSDGTNFSGRGFFADARNRTWAFSGEVKGTYVEKEDEDEKETEEVEWTREETEPVLYEAPDSDERGGAFQEQPFTAPKASVPEPETSAETESIVPDIRSSTPEQFPEPKPFIPVPQLEEK